MAALVIPNIVTNYQKQKTAIAVKKSYAELNYVLQMAINDHGDPRNWDYQTSEELIPWVQKYIQPYVKVISAGPCTSSRCHGIAPFHTLGYDPNLNTHSEGYPPYIITKAGSGIAWGFWRYPNWIWYEHTTRIRVWIHNPNQKKYWFGNHSYAFLGKDVFTFVFDVNDNKPRIMPYNPVNYDGPSNSRPVSRDDILGTGWGACNENASGSGYWGPGDACSALIMMDGWKIAPDYPW